MDVISSLIINNPVSQKIISTSKKVIFKNNGEMTSSSKEIVKTATQPLTHSLFEVNLVNYN